MRGRRQLLVDVATKPLSVDTRSQHQAPRHNRLGIDNTTPTPSRTCLPSSLSEGGLSAVCPRAICPRAVCPRAVCPRAVCRLFVRGRFVRGRFVRGCIYAVLDRELADPSFHRSGTAHNRDYTLRYSFNYCGVVSTCWRIRFQTRHDSALHDTLDKVIRVEVECYASFCLISSEVLCEGIPESYMPRLCCHSFAANAFPPSRLCSGRR